MSTTLPLFWKLSSASKKDRIDASVKLIGALEQFQAIHIPQPRSDGSDNEGDGLDTLNSQDVSYSMRRLVRGLASPRESSRLGFSVALTELLSRIDTVTCAQVVDLIVDGTKMQGSMSGQEERDTLFARLFGLTAVVRSRLLVRQRPLLGASSTKPVSSLEMYEAVLGYLLEIGDTKSWLRESAWWVVGLAIDEVQASEVPWKVEALESAIRVVYSKEREAYWTPDKVVITLKLQPLTPSHDWEKMLAPAFRGRNIFASNNLSSLGRIMKENAVDDEDNTNLDSGSWKAQIHVAWDVIFDRLLPPPGSEHVPQGSFSEFFRIVVDESLFSSSSSPERKHWGFQVFKKSLARVKATELPMLFTKNLMRSWINHLSNKDRYLHKISLDVAKHIQTLVQTSPSLGFPLILQLTGVNGSGQFDKLTRTKTVESILTLMDSAGIKSYIFSLLKQVNSPNDTEGKLSATDSRRIWIANQFAALIRNGSVPKDDEWIQTVLDFYIVNGLFVVQKKFDKNPIHSLRVLPSPPFTETVRQHCREKLLGSLGALSAHLAVVKQGEHTRKEAGVASDGVFWTSRALATITFMDEDARHVKPLIDIDEQVQASLAKVEKAIAQLRKADDDRREVARGFELILSSFLIQCRCGEADGLESLEATLEATSKMFPSEETPKKSKKTKSAENEPAPIDVLVDVIIGFLENASAFTRSIANESFARVTSVVRGSTVDLILSQLERRDPGELVDDEKMASDTNEEGNDEGSNEEDENEEESSEEGESGESDAEEGDDEAADQVRERIRDALKVNGVDVEKDESEEDSDEEELMDDEQMMALDDTLAEIFRIRTSEKRSKKGVDAQREATHFKNRVLDLVDIFAKREPHSPLNLRLVLPLIELATKSSMDERQLSDKANGVFMSRLAKSKDLPTTALRDEVEPVLRGVHRRAQRLHASASNALGLLSQASLYLCRILVSIDEGDVAVEAYRESLDDYVTRKASQLAFSFFQDWARRFPSLGWKLRDHVLESSSKAINTYRKYQALQLLHVILSQPNKGEEPAGIITFQKALQKTVLDSIAQSMEDDCGLSPAQTKDVLKLVLFYMRQTRKTTEGSTVYVWDPTLWKALHDKLSSTSRFKSSPVLNMCHQVETTAAQCKQAVGEKRKAELDERIDAEPSQKFSRKKQKKSKS